MAYTQIRMAVVISMMWAIRRMSLINMQKKDNQRRQKIDVVGQRSEVVYVYV